MKERTKPVDSMPMTLSGALAWHAARTPNRAAYTFLVDGEEKEASISFAELDRAAKILAKLLNEKHLKGERVLLLFPPGLDYLRGFFACLYAGAAAVPAYPPQPERLNRTLPRILSILKDCEPRLLLTVSSIQEIKPLLLQHAPELKHLDWLSIDKLPEQPLKDWSAPSITPGTLAFLQYTSGSTGEPKGVALTHANLINNILGTNQKLETTSHTRYFTWLPPYHDMGLIGDLLAPMVAGAHVFHMSPFDFLQKPVRWLRAITKYKITTSGGPNFAYQYCSHRISEEEKTGLDLSSWEVAYCGSEPIDPDTPKIFAKAFERYHFDHKAFYPCYGLAEATLTVSGGTRLGGQRFQSRFKNFQAPWMSNSLRANLPELGEWIGCGTSLPGQKIAIVRPNTHRQCPDRAIGEIWVRGPSIAKGYWKRPKQNRETFRARIHPSHEGPFLRTGDLGFIQDGELFVTGRLKDLIIIGGINHFPRDLEITTEAAHPAIRKGCAAAFSIPGSPEEKLVLVFEIDKRLLPKEKTLQQTTFEGICQSVIAAIGQKHEVQVFALGLLDKGNLPKTSSGKIQRQDCLQAYLNKKLNFLHHYQTPLEPSAPLVKKTRSGKFPLSEEVLKDWLVQEMARQLRIRPNRVDPARPFPDLGLNSRQMVGISGQLGDLLGIKVSPMLLWKYPSASQLAQHLGRGTSDTDSLDG